MTWHTFGIAKRKFCLDVVGQMLPQYPSICKTWLVLSDRFVGNPKSRRNVSIGSRCRIHSEKEERDIRIRDGNTEQQKRNFNRRKREKSVVVVSNWTRFRAKWKWRRAGKRSDEVAGASDELLNAFLYLRGLCVERRLLPLLPILLPLETRQNRRIEHL